MAVETIEFISGKTLKVIDGKYVIGAGGACQKESCLKGKVLNGEYWVDGCNGGYNCSCKDFKEWYVKNVKHKDIGDCEKITKFTLSNHLNIHTLPESICSLKNLREFYAENLRINENSIPDSMSRLTEITLLYLPHTKFRKIPDFILGLKNINKIDMSYVPIEELPDSFFNLTTLESLWIEGTNVSSIDNIGNLVRLASLHLSGTKITSLPESIGNLTNLHYLECIGMRLTSLPDSFGNLTGLYDVDLSANHLRELPDSIGNLDNDVISLDLTRNRFTHSYKNHIRNDLFPIANANGNLIL